MFQRLGARKVCSTSGLTFAHHMHSLTLIYIHIYILWGRLGKIKRHFQVISLLLRHLALCCLTEFKIMGMFGEVGCDIQGIFSGDVQIKVDMFFLGFQLYE